MPRRWVVERTSPGSVVAVGCPRIGRKRSPPPSHHNRPHPHDTKQLADTRLHRGEGPGGSAPFAPSSADRPASATPRTFRSAPLVRPSSGRRREGLPQGNGQGYGQSKRNDSHLSSDVYERITNRIEQLEAGTRPARAVHPSGHAVTTASPIAALRHRLPISISIVSLLHGV